MSPPPSAQVTAGQRAPLRLRRSALRADSPAVLGLRSRRITRYVRCAHCAQTDAASQKWKRAPAARADRSPALLGAAESLRPPPGRAFARFTEPGFLERVQRR